MPVPDFSPGEVLTAAAMDSIGLWLVKTQTIGTGVSSVTVTDAFSSAYDNYKIVISGVVFSSGSNGIRFNLGGTVGGANYFYGGSFVNTTTGTITGAPGNNIGFVLVGTSTGSNAHGNVLEVLSPQKTTRTTIIGGLAYGETGFLGPIYGLHNADTAFTSFTYYPTTGTMTGGVIRVYGYRN
jgi:hypothetical protein